MDGQSAGCTGRRATTYSLGVEGEMQLLSTELPGHPISAAAIQDSRVWSVISLILQRGLHGICAFHDWVTKRNREFLQCKLCVPLNNFWRPNTDPQQHSARLLSLPTLTQAKLHVKKTKVSIYQLTLKFYTVPECKLPVEGLRARRLHKIRAADIRDLWMQWSSSEIVTCLLR